ncbi:unnamed protein product [Notodromas monacha]|uniref:Protein RER1 n=1 Tax=Notodromas monacha TaxID=399045 RepID=A0A7R9BFE2_9CRUS|nr:unnamed protein product [Notodromas monacha]CAG0913100.1 unnamed protein product [Notodromas monacha]
MNPVALEETPVVSQNSGSTFFRGIGQKYQVLLDATVPFTLGRWSSAVILNLLFLLRIVIGQGWYVVTYGLGIYHLNLLILFLSPKIDPALAEFDDDEIMLPTRSDEEFRPFIRRLPEFKFWHSVMKATTVAFVLSAFEFTNIPVFWPILVMYFIMLFVVTMKRQIKHMIKYKYLPFTWGKPKYRAPETS